MTHSKAYTQIVVSLKIAKIFEIDDNEVVDAVRAFIMPVWNELSESNKQSILLRVRKRGGDKYQQMKRTRIVLGI
jgi:hypothetical protein